MTIYRGKTNKRRGRHVMPRNGERSRQHFINLILVFSLVGAFLGNVLVANDVAAKEHVITSLRSDFNKKTDTQYTPTPNDEIITMGELIEFAEENGMVESRDAIGLVPNGGVALSR